MTNNDTPVSDSATLTPEERHQQGQEQGYIGKRVDPTPDENYTVGGVIAGLPVPPIHPGQVGELPPGA